MTYSDKLPESPHRPALWGQRILIVDPDLTTAHFLLFQLEAEGAAAMSVTTIEDAIAIGMEWQPDILITKLALPDGDGHRLLDRLNPVALNQGKALLSIALTPFPHRVQSHRSLIKGFQYYLFGQVDRLTLLAEIKQIVGSTNYDLKPQLSRKGQLSNGKSAGRGQYSLL